MPRFAILAFCLTGVLVLGALGQVTQPAAPDAKHAQAQQAAPGTLTVRAVQGSAGGPAIAGDAVTVELYHRGRGIKKLEAVLNDQGTATLTDLPAGMGLQAVVSVVHRGVSYQATVDIDAAHADAQVQVTVYETTEEQPAWRIGMRHVMLTPRPEGLAAMEVVAITNPTDRTWIGAADEKGKRRTIALSLPPGASHVEAGEGFHSCCAIISDSLITNTMALLPGTTQYQFSYRLPIANQAAIAAFAAPTAIKQMVVLLPDDGAKVNAQGLESGGPIKMGKGTMLLYQAKDLQPGQQVVVAVSGLSVAAAQSGEGQPAMGGRPARTLGTSWSEELAKVIAGLGGLGVAAGALAVMLIQPSRKPATPGPTERTR